MGFPDYFNKNVQAARRLLQDLEPEAFKAVLEKEVIGIAYDATAAASAEGRAIFDLLVRLIARLYPRVRFVALDAVAKTAMASGTELAKAINPEISIEERTAAVTKWLVIGKTKLPRAGKKFVMYVGSENWLAKLSTKSPQSVGRSANPFGAGAAACLGIANLFRATFSKQLPHAKLDTELSFSVLSLARAGSNSRNSTLKSIDLGVLHLVGLGAIGNGFLWALGRTHCTGKIHVVDAEKVEISNLQRYALTVRTDVDDLKVDLGKKWLTETSIKVEAHAMRWEEYTNGATDWRFDCVAVAVDSERDRISIQASLPRTIFNSWTAGGELGLSRHRFVGQEACLACLYMPRKKTLNLDEIIASALHLPQDRPTLLDLRGRLELGTPTDRAFLERVAAAAHVPLEELLPFEGKPLREFYVQAVCGGAVLGFGAEAGQQQAEVPMAFQSTLAGVLLAADVVAAAACLRKDLPTITQLDLLNAVSPILSRGRDKQPDSRCICNDEDFIAAYRAKYL